MGNKYAAVNEAIPEEERQPTRRGLPERVREFDQTYLDPNAEMVHRDIAGHAGRWFFASRGPHPDILEDIPPGVSYQERFFKYGITKRPFVVHEETRVLDVGCGPDRPMLLALFGGIGPYPLAKSYTGVDLNSIKPTRHARSKLYPNTNFFEAWEEILEERGPFELITNFEVIEHMPKAMGLKLLMTFEKVLAPGGRILLSTPVYDGKGRARNHIHEYTIAELQHHIDTAGLLTVERFGTFANIVDIKKVCTPTERALLEELGEYYGNDVLSTFLAPKYPDASRNNLWVLGRAVKKGGTNGQRRR